MKQMLTLSPGNAWLAMLAIDAICDGLRAR